MIVLDAEIGEQGQNRTGSIRAGYLDVHYREWTGGLFWRERGKAILCGYFLQPVHAGPVWLVLQCDNSCWLCCAARTALPCMQNH